MKRPYVTKLPARWMEDGTRVAPFWAITWDAPNPHFRVWVPLRDWRRWFRFRR